LDVGVLVKGQNGKVLPGKIAPKRISEKGRPAFLGELKVWSKQVSELENLRWFENLIENQFPITNVGGSRRNNLPKLYLIIQRSKKSKIGENE